MYEKAEGIGKEGSGDLFKKEPVTNEIEKKIDGVWMRDLEKGELNEDAARMLLEKDWLGLGLFAWENRTALTHDPGLFVIEAAQDKDTTELEKEYQAKFISGEFKNGKFYALMKEWKDLNIEVNVWNCQAAVVYRDNDGKLIDFECSEDTQAKLDELAYKSVEDAGGWITMSGIYPPNKELIDFFRDSIELKKDAEL